MSGATENVNTNEEKIDVKSVKTPEELGLIAEEIKAEVEAEVKAEAVKSEAVPEEPKELTEEEKREIFIKTLKESKIKFHPVKHDGSITTNQFGASYRKARKRKNRIQKKSRKNSR